MSTERDSEREREREERDSERERVGRDVGDVPNDRQSRN